MVKRLSNRAANAARFYLPELGLGLALAYAALTLWLRLHGAA
jgi:enoyl-CoA hydratase/carnithine racemase